MAIHHRPLAPVVSLASRHLFLKLHHLCTASPSRPYAYCCSQARPALRSPCSLCCSPAPTSRACPPLSLSAPLTPCTPCQSQSLLLLWLSISRTYASSPQGLSWLFTGARCSSDTASHPRQIVAALTAHPLLKHFLHHQFLQRSNAPLHSGKNHYCQRTLARPNALNRNPAGRPPDSRRKSVGQPVEA